MTDVSVIVATRDRPLLLARALTSVARQSHRSVEVCVANDGGRPLGDTLRSTPELDGLAVRVVDLPARRGVPAARNAALAISDGDVAAYLDDDDELLEHHLESALDAMAADGAQISVASVYCRHRDGDLDLHFAYPLDPRFLLVTNAHPPVSLVHERVERRNELFDDRLTVMEDWDCLQSLVWDRGLRATHVRSPTAVYDRIAAAGSHMERLSADVFRKDYEHIVSKRRSVADAHVRRFQHEVIAWYDRQIAGQERADYESFLAALWAAFRE